VNGNLFWSADLKLHLLATDIDHGDLNLMIDHHRLIRPSRYDEPAHLALHPSSLGPEEA
jgi:hypothetical protein